MSNKTNVNYQDVDFTIPEQRVSLTVSSEDPEHPIDEIYNDDSLGSAWRTRGYWLIDETNNKMVFRDSSGVDLTATIDTGEYNSDTDFFAEIKSKMEVVGAHTYTISRNNETKKITISSDHSFFQIRWSHEDNTMADLLGFNPSTNSVAETTYNAANIALHTEEFAVFDFGSPVKPKFFALIGGPNEDLKITSGATLELQFNNTSDFSAPQQTVALDYHVNGLFKVDNDGISDDFYRYMKIKIIDRENVFGYVEVSKIACGSFIEVSRGSVQFPLVVNGIDKSTTQEMLSGQLRSIERNTTIVASFLWFALDAASKEKLEDHFSKDYKTAKSFFIFFDRDAVFSTDAARSFMYVRYSKPPSIRLINRGALWEMQHEVRVQL